MADSLTQPGVREDVSVTRIAWPRRLVAVHVRPLALLAAMVAVFYLPQLAAGSLQGDGVDVHFTLQRYLSDAIRSGRLPFWTPYVFAGFPFLADPQVGAWYPLNWLFFALGITPMAIRSELLAHALVACGGAYALARKWIGQPPAALATAIFYGLSGYFAGHSQHVGMFETAAWLPWLVLLLDALSRRLQVKLLVVAGWLGAALALPGHFQVALYAFCGAGAWALIEAAARGDVARAGRALRALLAVGLGGALLAAVMILPGLELTLESVRTQLDAATIDIGYFHVESLLTLVQPNFYGALFGKYVGPGDITQHYFYAGIGLVPLALLGLPHARARRAALGLGLPFLWYALGPVGGLFRLVVLLPGFHSVELPMHGWFLPALGLALLGGAGFQAVQARLRWQPLVPLLLAGLFVDVLVFNGVANRLVFTRESFDERYFAPLRSFAAQLETARPPVERLYGAPMTTVGYRNHPLQSRVETTYGYNPLELTGYAAYADAAEQNPRLVDGLAASHRLAVGTEGNVAVEPNPSALPLAFFARHVTSVPDEASLRAGLATLDPGRESLVVGPPPEVTPNPSARADVVERGLDYLTVRYRSGSAGLLRVAVPAFPGWQARLHGADLPIRTVDGALLGVVVPAGEGEIHLSYQPRLFQLGAAVSGLTMLGSLGLLAATARRRRAAVGWPAGR